MEAVLKTVRLSDGSRGFESHTLCNSEGGQDGNAADC